MLSVGHAWFLLNCLCSVAVVLMCKSLFAHGTVSTVSLTLLHYTATFAVTKLQDSARASPNEAQSAQPNTADIPRSAPKPLLFVLASFFFGWQIPLSHLSLALNTTAAFQLFKLGPMLTTALGERALGWGFMSREKVAAVSIVLFGVAIASIDTLPVLTFWGTASAICSVLCVTGSQLTNRYICTEYKVGGAELMNKVLPISILMLGAERLWSYVFAKQDAEGFEGPNSVACIDLAITCLLATMINVSVPECIKALSATYYNTVGHIKTVMVVALGTTIFGETISLLTIVGFTMALGGILMFGYASSDHSSDTPKHLSASPVGRRGADSNGGPPCPIDIDDCVDEKTPSLEIGPKTVGDLPAKIAPSETTGPSESDLMNRKMVRFCLAATFVLVTVRVVVTISL